MPVASAGEIAPDVPVTDLSPKEIFFPQSEVMFRFSGGAIEPPADQGPPIAVWGLRNCDSRSLSILDKVFGGAVQIPDGEKYMDPYWEERYSNSLLFGSACDHPLSTCFCNWFGGGPYETTGLDVFTVDGGDFYLLQPVSEKGEEFLKRSELVSPADEADAEIISRKASEAEAKMPLKHEVSELPDKLPGFFDEPVWDELSAKCVNCGACTFCCPTCHCFDMQDENRGSSGSRIRIWDSCMFPIFTREASGHNPRSLSRERVRQRMMHKFCYFHENYGEFLCTGCGRCVNVCPVNLDVRDVIRKLLEYHVEEVPDG